MTTEIVLNRSIVLLTFLLLTSCGNTDRELSKGESSDSDSNAATVARGSAPTTRINVVENTYHGERVEDPYRWLEDWNDEEVKSWTGGQNTYARNVLGGLPERPIVHARLTEILKSKESTQYYSLRMAGEETLFAMKRDPQNQQSVLVKMGTDGDPRNESVFIDPNAIDASGGTTIDWYKPSHSGELIAVSMSSGGSESGDVSVYEVASGSQVDVVVERVNGGTAGGDLAWFQNDSGFFYTRYPRAGERDDEDMSFYQQVWKHTLGEPIEDDQYVIGKHFPRIAEVRLKADKASGRLIVWVQDGDSNRFELYLRQKNGDWNKFSEFGDGVIQAEFGREDSIYVISRAGAPRGRILRIDAASPDIGTAEELVPQGKDTLAHSFYYEFSPSLMSAGNRLYAIYETGGPTELRVFSLDGEALAAPRQKDVSTAFGLSSAGGSDVYFGSTSYVSISEWSRFDASDSTTSTLALSSESPVDYSDVDVVRDFATSKDGTKIPINILLPKGTQRDGTHAILVTGYGGYGISMNPGYSMSRHILFEHGVLYAQANLRGGGEFGEEWHRQGNLTNKQNVFDDFEAVIRFLVENKYAAADRVAIVGGSNGGLLMGATVTQNPDLVAAVVSHVGIYDSLRVELDPNGEFNIPEFGTVKDAEQFAALYAYSPYHNIKKGLSYPPILLPTGENDPRVDPYHSRKFTARLQAAQGDDSVVLLRTSGDTGHGGGTPLDEVVELLTDQYAFVFHHLNVPVDDR